MSYAPFRAETQTYKGTTFGFSFTIDEDGSALDLTTLSKIEAKMFSNSQTIFTFDNDSEGSLSISGTDNNIVSGVASEDKMDIAKRTYFLELWLHFANGDKEVYAVIDNKIIDADSDESQGAHDWVLDIDNDSETVSGQVTSLYAETVGLNQDTETLRDETQTLRDEAANFTALEQLNDLGSISGSTEIDLSNGTVVQATLTGSVTLSFTGLPDSGTEVSFTLAFSGAETITYPSGTEFAGGSAPSINGPDYELPCSIDSAGNLTVYGVIDEIA